MKSFTLPLVLGLASLSLARTDISGCISSQTTNQWHEASMIWWVPDSGEICEYVDCGGGRAPPKTTRPGCPLYSGTATLTPNYMPGWGPNGKIAATTTTVAETTSSSKAKTTGDSTDSATTTKDSMVTAAPTSSPVVSMTTTISPISKTGNSTSSAATATSTGNAAGALSADMAGILAIAAVVMGGIAL